MHHIPLYGRVAWSSTYTWCTQKSRAADEKRQRVSDMPTGSMVGLYIIAATLLSRYRKFLFLSCQDAL